MSYFRLGHRSFATLGSSKIEHRFILMVESKVTTELENMCLVHNFVEEGRGHAIVAQFEDAGHECRGSLLERKHVELCNGDAGLGLATQGEI
jgi:hypothetical protein